LADFQGETLVLPDVRILGTAEKAWLRSYAASGKKLVVTGVDATQLGEVSSLTRFEDCPGKAYSAALEKNFENTGPDSQSAFLQSLKNDGTIRIDASPAMATSITRVDGKTQVYFANFAGLKGGVNPVQTPQTGVRITIAGASKGEAFFLPFLGDVQKLQAETDGSKVTYVLPAISKGAVFSFQPAPE
jgi:hypothetical protein